MNAGIQGLAADIFKVALVRIDAGARSGRLRRAASILQVHDEVLVEVPDSDERTTVGPLVIDLMRDAAAARRAARGQRQLGRHLGRRQGLT